MLSHTLLALAAKSDGFSSSDSGGGRGAKRNKGPASDSPLADDSTDEYRLSEDEEFRGGWGKHSHVHRRCRLRPAI
jgi:hypothetical protein